MSVSCFTSIICTGVSVISTFYLPSLDGLFFHCLACRRAVD